MLKTKTLPLDEYLTVSGAAKILKVSKQAVSKAVQRGTLKSHSIGHVTLIPKADLQRYKKTRKPGRPKLQK